MIEIQSTSIEFWSTSMDLTWKAKYIYRIVGYIYAIYQKYDVHLYNCGVHLWSLTEIQRPHQIPPSTSLSISPSKSSLQSPSKSLSTFPFFNWEFQSRISNKDYNQGLQSIIPPIQHSNPSFQSIIPIHNSNPGFQSKIKIQDSNPGLQSRISIQDVFLFVFGHGLQSETTP